MLAKKDEYISLREAAKISGYSPDYVGQLIRSGKLPGKQVFSHVAWMTTEDALKEYMHGKKRVTSGEHSLVQTFFAIAQSVPGMIRRQFQMPRLFATVLYIIVALMFCFLILLFYIFSTSLERELNQKAIQRAENANTMMR